jgi:hypothetical protein
MRVGAGWGQIVYNVSMFGNPADEEADDDGGTA